MKKKTIISLILLALSAGTAFPQHYLGARGGYGLGFGRFYTGEDPVLENEMVWGLWSGGLAWKYYSSEKFVGGIGAEVEFLQRGYEFHIIERGQSTDRTYRRTLSSIHVPLLWQPHINMFENRFRVFLNAGVSVSYNFPTSKVEHLNAGEVTGTYTYRNKLIRDSSFGYGLCGGLGFNIISGRFEFAAEARYYIGFGDVLRYRGVYNVPPDGSDPTYVIRNPLMSPLDNINVSVGFFYRLTDGAHNPKPSKRQLRKQAQREEEQLMEALREIQPKEIQENGIDKTTESSETDPEGY